MSVPKIRFNGFQDEWQRSRLAELANIYDGIHETPDYKDYGVPFISVENINDISITNKYISKNDYERLFKIKPQYNDIFMTRIGSIGVTNVFKYNYDLSYYVSLALIRLHQGNADYLSNYLSSQYGKSELWKYTLHIAFPKKINKADIGKIEVSQPSLVEQQQIGAFFSKLDALISAQSKKLTLLKQLKHGYLQRMFPQADQTIPQVRFNGFSNEWIIKKMSCFLKERNEYDNTRKYPLVSFTKYGVEPKSDRYDREFLVRKNNKKYKVTYINDLVYNPANLKFGAISLNNYGTAEFSPIYITFKIVNINNNYIGEYVKSTLFLNKSLRYQEGTVYERKSVKVNDFLSIKIKLPILMEQEKIAKLLTKLDQLIALQNHKLALLQELKKGYLQKMFC